MVLTPVSITVHTGALQYTHSTGGKWFLPAQLLPFPRQLKHHTRILQQHRVTSDHSLEGAGVALGKISSLNAVLESEAGGEQVLAPSTVASIGIIGTHSYFCS